VEKDFHLEISIGQGEERMGVSIRISNKFQIHNNSTELYTLHNEDRHICTHATMKKVCMYAGDNEENHVHVLRLDCMGSYNQGEIAMFAGDVYSFMYFLVGHFPGKGALVSFDIILMIS
jgi:hypothetical protein